MVIYIQYKLHEIPSIGHLVMAEGGKVDGRTEKPEGWRDGQCQTDIPPPSAGDNKITRLS